jgi:hypothetical protein
VSTVKSFQDLGKTLKPLPRLPRLEEINPADVRTRAFVVKQGVPQIEEWVAATLMDLDRLNETWKQEADPEIRRIMQEDVRSRTFEAEASLEGLLHKEATPAWRRAAWLQLFLYYFSKELKTRQEAQALLAELVEKGYLVEQKEGELQTYGMAGMAFTIPIDAMFGAGEEGRVRNLLISLCQRIHRGMLADQDEKAKELQNRRTLNRAELLAGKAGTYVGLVPAEVVHEQGKEGEEAREYRRGGGTLLVVSDGLSVSEPEASGSIESAMSTAKERKVSVLIGDLYPQKATPPLTAFPTDRWLEGKEKEEFVEKGRKAQLVWHLLRRAFMAEEEEERFRAFRDGLNSQVTVSPQDFFLKGVPGICLVELKAWKTSDNKVIPHLFLLVERKEVEGAKKIQVVQVPEHLGDYFSQCMAEYTEGPKFGGIAYPLIAVLQRVFGQVFRAAAASAPGQSEFAQLFASQTQPDPTK